MADTAAFLVDRVLPKVPVRQWVLSLPIALRYKLAYDSLEGYYPDLVGSRCDSGSVALGRRRSRGGGAFSSRDFRRTAGARAIAGASACGGLGGEETAEVMEAHHDHAGRRGRRGGGGRARA